MNFFLKMFSKSLIVLPLLVLSFVSSLLPQSADQNTFSPENQIAGLFHNLFPEPSKNFQCSLPSYLQKEIESYQPIVVQIANAVTNGHFKGKVYEELAYFVDKFGSRLGGTKNLEDSLDYMINLSNHYNLENVHGEPALIPHWERGSESATMLMPRSYKMRILGLGGSISTPPSGITAEVLVVNSFDDLQSKAEQAKGKIVVFNQKWVSYPVSVKYRAAGATEAAKVGAVAALIRSITPMSLYTPHTGWQNYDDKVRKIPTASITVEDAEMFQRISDRGEKIVLNVYMEASTKESTLSKNVVAELTGSNKKDEIVLVSGHIDSWDVGQGAMDDGAGAFVSLFGVIALKHLGLRPKRTVRALLWTGEEAGLVGVKHYVNSHMGELQKFNLVMESDEGTFTPEGIKFSGVRDAACILQKISQLMVPLNATKFKIEKYVGSDITEFIKLGVPAADLMNKNDKYFWYHHTDADTMTLLDSNDLDRNVAMYAALSYITADLSMSLPRSKECSEGKGLCRKSNQQNFNGINLQGNKKFLSHLIGDDKYMQMGFNQGNQIDRIDFRSENDIRTQFLHDE